VHSNEEPSYAASGREDLLRVDRNRSSPIGGVRLHRKKKKREESSNHYAIESRS